MGNEKLFEAIKEDDVRKFKWSLRQRDVYINATQQVTGSTALHLALGKSEFVKELLLYKPRLDIFDEEGFTPLHIAAKYGYVESQFLLISYGADINAKRDEMSPTPLDLALQDDFSTTSVDYLLFCGAELTKRAQEKLGAEALERHETILQGYESGKIKFQGKTLPVGEWEPLEQLQIAVQNLSDDEVELFCRRIEPQYQDYEEFTPKIPLCRESQTMMDNDELKSDIFQVKIDSPAAFNLNLPIYHKRGQKDNIEDTLYASLVLKICHRTLGRNVVTEATDIEYCDGKVTVYNAVLGIQGQSPVVAIAVFLRTKTEHRTLAAHQSETLESHTENNFRISTTEQTFNEPTDVTLKVLKVVDTPEVSEGKAQEVIGNSDFCSALSADTPAEDVITIQLPKPTIIASSSRSMCATLVLRCGQGDDGQKPENWTPVENDVAETTDCVKLSKSGFGHYIVLAVKVLKKVGRNLKRLVSRLYASATGKITYCSLLAMTQKLNTSSSRSFTILCVLCRFDQIEDTIAKYEKDNYVIQPCSKSRTISVNTQQVYILTFELFNAKLMSKLKQLPLQYKDSHDSFQTITVEATGKDHSPHGNVFLLKRKVSEAKRKDVAFGEHLAVLVPVIFDVGNLSERPGTLQLDVSLDVILRTRLGDFLDDRILLEIATKLGDDWFEILVGLGMSVMELKGLDMTRHNEANLLMLKRWRSKTENSEDLGLCELLTSLTRAARIDLRRLLEINLDKYVQYSWRPDLSPSLSNTDTVDAPVHPSSQDQFRRWLNGFRTEDDTLKIDVKTLINETVTSPFEDSFLFYISHKIVGDDLIPLKLGLNGSKYEDMKHINPPSRRMCQMLAVLKAAQTEDPPCSFIRQLLKEIKNSGNHLAVMEIEERIQEWYERYKRGGSGFSKEQMESIKQRLKIDLKTK